MSTEETQKSFPEDEEEEDESTDCEQDEEQTTKSTSPKLSLKRGKATYGPTKERIMKSVPPPASHILPTEELFTPDGIDPEALKKHLFAEGRISIKDLETLITQATEIFAEEPNLLSVPAPVTVCGDTHGQFYDLLKLFEVGGNPSTTSYLFLGDYVDRGNFSLECVLLLWAYKIKFPTTMFLLRGNHECRHLTDYFTFKEECRRKYNLHVYDLIMESFDTLPLGAIMNRQFLCIHGGISPAIQTLEDIETIDRFTEPPQQGPMCDLLWADPMEDYAENDREFFRFNDIRGCSYQYGFRAVSDFLQKNGLLCIIRAHEAQDSGYKMFRKSKDNSFPTVITLFSAPNYLDSYGNKAAILRYEENVMNIRQFNHSPHPYYLPNFMDVFSWSLPFVAEKVSELILYIFQSCEEELVETVSSEEEIAKEKEKRRQQLRAKIKYVSKFMAMYSVLRSEREGILLLKDHSEQNVLPKGLLSGGVSAIREAVGNFQKAKEADQKFEKRPRTPIPRSESQAKFQVKKLEHTTPRGSSSSLLPTILTEDLNQSGATPAS